jgi:hypothetical protein
MDNQETLVTLGTQDIGRRQTKHSTTEITKKMNNTDPTKKPGLNAGALECSHIMLT